MNASRRLSFKSASCEGTRGNVGEAWRCSCCDAPACPALPQARRAAAELQAQLDEARSQRDEQRAIVAHLHTESAGDKHQLETLREQLAELRAQLNSAAEGSKARANQQSKVRGHYVRVRGPGHRSQVAQRQQCGGSRAIELGL